MLMGLWCELPKIKINEDDTHATYSFTGRRSTQSHFALNTFLLLGRKGFANVSKGAAAQKEPTSRHSRVIQLACKNGVALPCNVEVTSQKRTPPYHLSPRAPLNTYFTVLICVSRVLLLSLTHWRR
jgi:hypothetical protein